MGRGPPDTTPLFIGDGVQPILGNQIIQDNPVSIVEVVLGWGIFARFTIRRRDRRRSWLCSASLFPDRV